MRLLRARPVAVSSLRRAILPRVDAPFKSKQVSNPEKSRCCNYVLQNSLRDAYGTRRLPRSASLRSHP